MAVKEDPDLAKAEAKIEQSIRGKITWVGDPVQVCNAYVILLSSRILQGVPNTGATFRGIYKAVSVTFPNKLPVASNDGQCFWVVGPHCVHILTPGPECNATCDPCVTDG
jgi:hypothetical protein